MIEQGVSYFVVSVDQSISTINIGQISNNMLNRDTSLKSKR